MPTTTISATIPNPPSTAESFKARKQNAAVLASQYTKAKRFQEIISIIAFLVFLSLSLRNLAAYLTLSNAWVLLVSCFISMILADLFSGLVHWGADSWGSLDTPLVGKTFIRSFREHHVDPASITCHDVIETNGDNCLTTVVPLIIISFWTIRRDHETRDMFFISFICCLAVWVALTNQLHKWAHMRKPPNWVCWLQDVGIVLSRKNHQVHHHTPFDRYYCITTGWLNPILGAIGFWRGMEIAITAMTGAIPREDDAYWTVQVGNQASGDDLLNEQDESEKLKSYRKNGESTCDKDQVPTTSLLR